MALPATCQFGAFVWPPYDAAGNVTSLSDGQNSGQVQSYGYDWLDRLVNASTNAAGTGQYNHTYAYNAIGNLTNYAGNPYTYGTKPHAVTAAYGNSYAYDGNGNQTTRTIGGVVYTFTYDYENRLTGISGGSISASFIYDAEGNRVRGTIGSTTTVYVDGLYEYQGGATTKYYESGALRRSGYGSSNGVFYILSDQLQSTSRILAQNNTVAAMQYYYPFGGNRGGAFSTLTTKRFTGQYHESSIPGGEGLSYYGARWYDAKLGRFISADTIVPSPQNPQTLNRYAYVVNNPLKYVDPTGHREAECTSGETCTGSVVSYIRGEMNRNPHTPVANKIKGYIQRSNRLMKLSSQFASQENGDKGIASLLLLAALANRASAYELWRQQVDYEAPWDHKPTIRRRFGSSQVVGNYRYSYDVWSNIHYGDVGASVGLKSEELLWGAGAAQYLHERQTNFANPMYVDEVLSKPLATRLDYPTDQAAIRLGIHLWNTYGSSLTQEQFVKELENWTGLDREPYP